MEDLLEAALGPEAAYWRTRGVTCEDVANTVSRLHNTFLDSVKVVLIRNNTWHFLHPAAGAGSSSSSSSSSSDSSSLEKSASAEEQAGGRQTTKGAGGAGVGGGSRTGPGTGSKYGWPELVDTPFGECPSPCQAQLQGVYDTVARRLHRGPRGAPGEPPYSLPDMVFVVNAADNMQRFGLHSRAPILSLLKRWEVPWWGGDNATAPRLGRTHPGGELLQPMPLPSRVRQALEGNDVAAAVAAAATATVDGDAAGQLEGSTVGAQAGVIGAGGAGATGIRGAAGGSGVRRAPKRRKKGKSRPDARRALLQQVAWRGAAAAAGRAHGPGGSMSAAEQGEEGVAGGAGASGLATHSAERSRGLRETRLGGAATAGGGGAAGAAEAGPASGGGGAGGGDKLWDMVRRFVASRSPAHLPRGVTPPDRTASPPPPGRRGQAPRKPPYDLDLLLPTMAFVPRTLISFPWKHKKDVAFFSGVPFCPLYVDPHRICPRVFLANLSTLHPAALDVRLVRPWVNKRLGAVGVFRKPVTLPQHPPTPMPGHARYRWLLNVDGLSASTRMGFLMTTDSVILKSRSPFIEYYSRLQTPGSHYLEFWSNASDPYDVLGVLAAARATAAADPAAVAAAARANQAIAARYIAMQPKLLYARAALLAYHALVPGMAECVEDLVASMEATRRSTGGKSL
ncbi:hypothetical protein HYH02_012095 [Chlamydomonas schloesseri]|uniref:Glycosyl transferase CAP10 domain-containing protein n=1 Tax=Chlamydomonas schloesseri TaxID=2026947 RepID=A0A835T056_9CHLO|nr:hypothetical protein HYH02_012095 [Chlamydomonas schloesseri]|eukprot:KAG2434896.1 hypothetical protein HYH02_012095 [Chlamydomonas schloesseri]